MSQYQHAFSDYVNHILNKSPSKTTFSFSKTDRFPKQKIQQPLLLPTSSPTQYYHELHHHTNRTPTRRSPRKSPRKHQQQLNENHYEQSGYYHTRNHQKISSPQREVGHILKKIQRKQQSRSPNQSPYKKYYKEYITSPTRARGQTNRQGKSSPLRQRTFSPHKTFYTEMAESNHPSRNITITGYYPLGLEINAQGRYTSSKIRNVTCSKFSTTPLGRMNRQRGQNKMGPGFYTSFSEFGPG